MVQGGDEHDAQPTLQPDAQDAAPTLAPDAQDVVRTLAPGPLPTPSPRDVRTRADAPNVTLLPPGQVVPGAAAPAGRATYMTYRGAAPTAADHAAPARTELIGDFELLEPLGEGGMGVVYRARQRALDRQVALKVLTPKSATTPEAAERFAREARAAAAVNHPNVITIIAAGRDERSGRLYMAMELVRGGDAEQLAQAAGGKLPERRALEVLRDCARGLVAIERAGLVHRDIKPQNIFVTTEGVAKLADLGLARSQAGDDRVTQTGLVVGTPAFMCPEQAQGELDLDVRTDIYALGATLFRLLTGLAPYEGPSVMAILTKVVREPVPDPRKHLPSISARTAEVVLRAMAKDRADRHASAADLLADVEEALAALTSGQVSGALLTKRPAPTRSAPARPAPRPAPAPDEDDEEEEEGDEDEDDKPPIQLVVGAAVLLVLMIGAGLWLVTRPRATDAPPDEVVATTEPVTTTEEVPVPTVTEPPVEVATATEAPPPATEAPPPPATEAPPPPATEAPPPPATEAPPPPPATEAPPPPATETAPPPATEAPPPPPPETPVVFRIGGAARRSSERSGAHDVYPEPFGELVTLHSERPRPLPTRVRFTLSDLVLHRQAPEPDPRRPPPPDRPGGGALPTLDGLAWGKAPDGLVLVLGARPGDGPVDARADLAGVVGAVLVLTPSKELRVGVLTFPPGAAPAKRSVDLLASPVLSRKEWRYSPDQPVEVIVDIDAQGWRVELVHGDLDPIVVERAWTDRARDDASRGVVFFADAANQDWEGSVRLAATAR
jgi:serine/threonine protein kinase